MQDCGYSFETDDKEKLSNAYWIYFDIDYVSFSIFHFFLYLFELVFEFEITYIN